MQNIWELKYMEEKYFVHDNKEMISVSHANQRWGEEEEAENALHLASEACQFTSVDTFQQHTGSMGGMHQHD